MIVIYAIIYEIIAFWLASQFHEINERCGKTQQKSQETVMKPPRWI